MKMSKLTPTIKLHALVMECTFLLQSTHLTPLVWTKNKAYKTNIFVKCKCESQILKEMERRNNGVEKRR